MIAAQTAWGQLPTRSRTLPEHKLLDGQGRYRQLSDFRGKVLLIYPGYISCPDACPTSLAKLADVMKRLKRAPSANIDRLQVVFITLDPARDTPSLAQTYAQAFDPHFVALWPHPEQLSEITRSLGVYLQKIPGRQADSYMIDHTTTVEVYDGDGRWRMSVPPTAPVDMIAKSLRRLLEEHR